MFKKLIRAGLLAAVLTAGLRLDLFAAAITPDTIYPGSLGNFGFTVARFTAGTADDTDTWASGLGTRVVAYWTSDDDNPTTQASTGVGVTYSAGTFTFYPAEDNKPFTLFVLTR